MSKKYQCHLCAKENCEKREDVKSEDFIEGVSEYCPHGFERKDNKIAQHMILTMFKKR